MPRYYYIAAKYVCTYVQSRYVKNLAEPSWNHDQLIRFGENITQTMPLSSKGFYCLKFNITSRPYFELQNIKQHTSKIRA